MYDHQTDTLWSQLLGEAVQGELSGTKLEVLPAMMTTWEEWKTIHPDTLAIQKGFVGNWDAYSGYYTSSDEGVLGVEQSDDRLGAKEFVIGVNLGQDAVAYPFGVLDRELVVNDLINDVPAVVVFDSDTATGVVWKRNLADGRLLTFTADEGENIRDLETGTLWNGFSGQAITGELAGEKLKQIPSTLVFWFAWFDFHPATRLYGHDQE